MKVNKAGGIDGKKLRILESDNKSEPSEAGNSVTKLVTQDKVIAVVGPATSGCVAASTPITTANKVPLIDTLCNCAEHYCRKWQSKRICVPFLLYRSLPGTCYGRIC